jgi:hypothetical protein
MKQRIIISLTSFAIGFILVLLALVPLRIDFQVPFIIGLIGLILLLTAFVYGLAILYPRKKQDGKLISSRLTPVYKFYFPVTFIACLLFNTLLILLDIYPGNDISIFIVLEIMFIIWLALFIPCIRLRLIHLNNNQIITTNFLEESTLQISSIKSVKRYFIFLYKLNIGKGTSSQKIILLPRLTEFSNLFITPKSIKELKSLINH